MKINVEIIPHQEQRYETCGDWYVDREDVIQIRVSRLSDPRYARLILIHELVEVLLEWQRRGGNEAAMQALVLDTDSFDKAYEATRPSDDPDSEPGYEPDCPVYQGHMAASAIEHVAAMVLGVNYNDYAKEVSALSKEK